MQKIILIVIALGVAACSTPKPKRDTYDLINDEISKAADVKSQTQSDAVSAALLPPLTIEVPQARQPLEERFSMTFNNVPASQFFNAIVTGTRYNMLVHPEVGGTISANLKDVTLFEALDAVREMYGYDYKVEGSRIVIKPLTLQTSVFQVNYLTGNRKGSSDIRVISNSANISQPNNGTTNNGSTVPSSTLPTTPTGNSGTTASTVDSSKISTTSNSDFWSDLKSALETIVGKQEGRSVVISPQSGVVVIRAMPDELHNVAAYLKASQLSVDRQVILEAKILEVQLNSNYQTGINWSAFTNGAASRVSSGFISPGASLSPLSSPGNLPSAISSIGTAALNAVAGSSLSTPNTNGGSLFGLALQTSNFAALISFLESQGSVHVLSNPRIATLNNQKAVLKVGTDDFFVTNVSTTTTSGGTSNTTTPNVTLQPFFSGVVLDVTPQIDATGSIILHVHPSVSQVSTVTQTINLGVGGTLILPLASSATQETDSIVRGQDGHIIAIGGLMKQNTTSDRSQLPGAGDLPVIGNLFRNTGETTTKSELVILIKPTVVQDSSSWNQDILDSQQRILDLDPRNASKLR